MKKLMKFIHELGACGVMGALSAHLVLVLSIPQTPAIQYAAVRAGIDVISRWILLPSLLAVLVSGLLSIAVHQPFHNSGWVWVKALTGVSMLEGTLGAVQGTATRAAQLSARVAQGLDENAALADTLRHEWGGLLVILALSVANVALAVWRPRLFSKGKERPQAPT